MSNVDDVKAAVAIDREARAFERARILALLDHEAIVLDAVLNAQFDLVKPGGTRSQLLLNAYRAALRAAIEKED